jgi:hypothetical protein
LAGGIPMSESRHLALRCAGRSSLFVMFAFGSFGAAVFAEPPVTEIEKVIGLRQVKGETDVESGAFQRRRRPIPDTIELHAWDPVLALGAPEPSPVCHFLRFRPGRYHRPGADPIGGRDRRRCRLWRHRLRQ